MYPSSQIIGRRLGGAPNEDLLFGFSMTILTLSLWDHFERRVRDKTKVDSEGER
jgi:hypothetical protein